MRRLHSLALVVCTVWTLISPLSRSALGAEEPMLLVMLQGQNLQQIREATLATGAQITHELPVINALGVRMTRLQLDSLREHPALERVIDDLAYEPEPDLQDNANCPLAGALQLQWHDATARWSLFNKGKDTLQLTRLELTWPPELGLLRAVSLGEQSVALPQRAGPKHQTLLIDGKLGDIAGQGKAELSLSFDSDPDSEILVQNAITLSIAVDSDCNTTLVPTYASPSADSYYPGVSGAALLQRHGLTGSGVTVAVLDSGLWEEPDELSLDTHGEPRVTARYDAQADREVSEATDESGHGTHLTSVLASSRAVTRAGAIRPSYRGIAPDASIVVVKAFDSGGEAGFLDIVRGVQWVIDNRERLDIRVLNLSFASRPRWPYWEDPVNQSLMRAWEAGITVIAAAGNEGPEPMSIGSPGNLPYLITVGAITDSWTEAERYDDYLPDFSSRGPTPMGHIKPDVVAYGGHIAGVMVPGATLGEEFPEYHTDDGYFVMTGTSQAAAVVSGLAALLIQAEPDVSNDDIKCMLMSSAEPAISSDGRLAYSPFLQGSGLVNVSRAITVGDRECGNEGLALTDDITGTDHFQGPAEFPPDGVPPRLPGQEQLINPTLPEKGTSDSRRWGAAAHLERLDDPSAPSPIDWLGLYQSTRARMETLAEETR
jgi:serine protease AprX